MNVRKQIRAFGLTAMVLNMVTTVMPASAQLMIEKVETITPQPTILPQTGTTVTKTVETYSHTAQTTDPTTAGHDEVASLKLRLDRMKEQIDLGLQKEWLSQSDANTFKSKADQLTTRVDDLSRQDYTQDKANEIEQQVNALNVSITSSMRNASTK
jgi:hypothetical protein